MTEEYKYEFSYGEEHGKYTVDAVVTAGPNYSIKFFEAAKTNTPSLEVSFDAEQYRLLIALGFMMEKTLDELSDTDSIKHETDQQPIGHSDPMADTV